MVSIVESQKPPVSLNKTLTLSSTEDSIAVFSSDTDFAFPELTLDIGFWDSVQIYLVPPDFSTSVMAAKILANVIVMGSGILARALVQAYRQALANASKSGVAQETMHNIRRASKTIAEPEARQILGVTEGSSWEEILKKYDHLFEQNAKTGSFYLQSKVHRAKECLEAIYQKKAQGT
ncbi:hypothetical protein L1049_027516 [Liquidambar formosana]|uniref:Mitochondrial import inner membrane translocase subunit Tim16 n=1 Tax=Liquidambar formosana TaxID=63359 RepID=A0AAP0WSL2_LIQFO